MSDGSFTVDAFTLTEAEVEVLLKVLGKNFVASRLVLKAHNGSFGNDELS